MTLFFDAVFITLGIFTAAVIATLAGRVAARITLEVREYRRRQSRLAYARLHEHRMTQARVKANQMLAEDSGLAELVQKLKNNPYVDGDNVANYQRAKLQKQLRELVPNKTVRDIFYAY